MHLSSSLDKAEGVGACSSHSSNRGIREKQKHMKPPKEPVYVYFCPKPLARTSHMALSKMKRQRNTLHLEEAAKKGEELGPIIQPTTAGMIQTLNREVKLIFPTLCLF